MEAVLHFAAHRNLSFREIEDLVLIEILTGKEISRDASILHGNFDFSSISEDDCKEMFRFEKRHIPMLCEALGIEDFITVQTVKVTALEGLCIILRRLAHPSTLADLEIIFGRDSSCLSCISNHMVRVLYQKFSHLLRDLTKLPWLTKDRLQTYAQAVSKHDAPLKNCWGFVGATTRGICKPILEECELFLENKGLYSLKYQSVICPDGIIIHLSHPYPGGTEDPGILHDSGLFHQLEQVTVFNSEKYLLYGDLGNFNDSSYPVSELIVGPYTDNLTSEREEFNEKMNALHQAVEWAFFKVGHLFSYTDWQKLQKIKLQLVGEMYAVSVLLTNCHTCLYGSQVRNFFQVQPPTFQEYLCIT